MTKIIKDIKTILVIVVTLSGCNSFSKIMNGSEAEPIVQPEILSTMPEATQAPNFNISIPDGYTRKVYYGSLVASKPTVTIQRNSTMIQVFIKEISINRWFKLGNMYSQAFWYTYDKNTGVVTYHGTNLGWKEYCLYEYTPIN